MAEAQPGALAPNPLGGAQALEDRFQGLYEAGAFEPSGKTEELKKVEPQAAAPELTPEPEQSGDPDYANFEDYLQKSGLERESFLALPIRVKVDGKDLDVPLSDVVKNYGLEKHFQAKSVALAEQQKSWEAQQTQAKQALEQQLKDASSLANLAHQNLLSEFQAIDWNKLRMDNPSEWAVRNTEFNQRASQIQNYLTQVQQAQRQQAEEADKARAAGVEKERDKMMEARPEWRDQKQFTAARSEISQYARNLGFTDAEIGSIFDHRYMLVLHDAARFAALQAQAPQRLKQVRTAPLAATPGARTTRDPKVAAAQQAKERWMKDRRDEQKGAAYFETLAS